MMLPLMEVLTSDDPHLDAQTSVIKRRFGMTLLVDEKNKLVVANVATGGIAANGGILLGDTIVGITLSND